MIIVLNFYIYDSNDPFSQSLLIGWDILLMDTYKILFVKNSMFRKFNFYLILGFLGTSELYEFFLSSNF